MESTLQKILEALKISPQSKTRPPKSGLIWAWKDWEKSRQKPSDIFKRVHSVSTKSTQIMACLNGHKVSFLYMTEKGFTWVNKFRSVDKKFDRTIEKLWFSMSTVICISSNEWVEIQSEWRFKRINVYFQQLSPRPYQYFTSITSKAEIVNSYVYTVILAWKLLWSYLLTYGKSVLLYFYNKKARDSYINLSFTPHYNTLEFLLRLLNHDQNIKILQMVFISSIFFIHYTYESSIEIFLSAFCITIECQPFSTKMCERF